MAFDRDRLKSDVAAMAKHGVFVGTSSWKHEGWLGQLDSPERYEYRGKFAETRFERDCLAEYSEWIKTGAEARNPCLLKFATALSLAPIGNFGCSHDADSLTRSSFGCKWFQRFSLFRCW